jgi:nitrile hydratase accessory protein
MSDGVVRSEIVDMRGRGALPRSNGELVFAAPWEGRAMAMAIGVVKALGLTWEEFRLRLIAEISAHPERPYYENWLAALEHLVIDTGAVSADKLAGFTVSPSDVISEEGRFVRSPAQGAPSSS